MSDYFSNVLATAFPKAIEAAQIGVMEVQSQFTKAGSYGGSRMWIEIESVYVACIPRYGQALIERLTQFDIKHTMVEASDFNAAVESVRALAEKYQNLYAEKQSGGAAFSINKRDFDLARLQRATDEATNEIEARKAVFDSQRASQETGDMTDSAEFFKKLDAMGRNEVRLALAEKRFNERKKALAEYWLTLQAEKGHQQALVPNTTEQAKHLTALAEEMRGVLPKFRPMFGTLQLDTQDESNYRAMLADAQASVREFLGASHEFTSQFATLAREVGEYENPSQAQVERGIALLQRAAGYLTSRPRVPNNRTAVAAMGMDALLEAAHEESRLAALHAANFGDTRTHWEVEQDELTKIYLGDKRIAPTSINEMVSKPMNKKIFLVHGHDHDKRDSVALFLTKLGLVPIVLDEQASKGMTIIEKFEAHRDVGFALVLMTPDDEGRSRKDKEAKPPVRARPRARQNVILEMGYFMAHLRREGVCYLTSGGVEVPSDLHGIVTVSLDDSDWRNRLAVELEAAKFEIDRKGGGVVT